MLLFTIILTVNLLPSRSPILTAESDDHAPFIFMSFICAERSLSGVAPNMLHNCVDMDVRSFVPANAADLMPRPLCLAITLSACTVFQSFFCITKTVNLPPLLLKPNSSGEYCLSISITEPVLVISSTMKSLAEALVLPSTGSVLAYRVNSLLYM